MFNSKQTSFRRLVALVGLLFVSASAMAVETRQEQVHRMSHHVMPFDMARTLHVFRMTENGGSERVVARDAHDSEQIRLIRQHLRHEAEKFQQGDYSDPARLHGAAMPGLKELQANAAQIKVTYAEISDGAQITFETGDLRALTAIHRWFGAQLSEHGADARAE
jgi:hypothetical protein